MARLIDADALFKAFEKAAWYNNADRDGIAEEILLQMPTIEQPTWISCAERLPDENKIALAWSEPTGDMFFSCGCDFKAFEVTHWMPLPQPPKGDE